MEQKILYDHRLLPSDTLVAGAGSRGLRYGEGLFETMKVLRGELLLASYHFDRLWNGMSLLNFEPFFTRADLEEGILTLCASNGHAGLGRVRLNVFRGDSSVHFVVETFALERAFTPPDGPGLDVEIFPHGRKSIDAYAHLKSNNYLLYLLGAAWAREQGLGECLILNGEGRVADASIANVFWVMGGRVYTPPLSEGGIAGVTRRYLLERTPVLEAPLSPAGLEGASEIFLTNAISGIRWVRRFGEKTYGHTHSADLCQLLR